MKILILANNHVGLYNFRKELLLELINQGNEVYISLPKGELIEPLINLGCKFIDTDIDRRGINPIKDFILLKNYFTLIKNLKPEVVITYTIKPNIYGGIICRITKTPYLVNITGLGTAIENQGLLKKIILGLYKQGISKASCVFFQNKANLKKFVREGIVSEEVRLIPGSGVNLMEHKFEEYPEKASVHRFLFIGRIMRDKGIDELLEAAKKVKDIYPTIEFQLVGEIEEEYEEILKQYEEKGIIKYYGQQKDVHSFIKKSNAVILPSYHEGLSNALLESASSGRPVLASRVPGCLETFDEDITGLGFEAKDSDSLKEAIIKFINLPYEKKQSMGLEARKKMEKDFDRKIVINAYIEEINKINSQLLYTNNITSGRL